MKRLLLLFLLIVPYVYAAQDYKIYDTLQVTHNTIRIDIIDFKNQTITGRSEISLRSKMDDLRYIPILLQDMRIEGISINNKAIKGFQYDGTLLRIPVSTPLRKGEEAKMTIAYSGKPTGSDFGGLIILDSLRTAHNMGSSLDEIPHSYGRSWFPASDDFRSRSTFDLYYRVNSNLKAISSGILQDTIPHGDGTTTWHWRINHAIPDYLVAMAVGDYEGLHYSYRQSSRDLPIDIYVFPNEVEAAKEAYAIVPKTLEVMEKYFGEMIFDRVGYVSVNKSLGAMEHVNNISMPINPNTSVDYQSLIIHELIHSWFGNRVTCATSEDMWLNEGITTFLTGVVMDEIVPEASARQYWKSNQATSVIMAPVYDEGYHPLYPMPQAYTYGPTVYVKGAMVMCMLREYLGQEVLFASLKKYLETYSLKHVTTADFLAFMSESTGKDLSGFFDQWVYRPGMMGFEIDSLKGEFDGNSYKGAIYLEQKLSGTLEYGKAIRIPITFFDKKGLRSEKIGVEVNGARTQAGICLPFEPSFGIVDTDYQLCKASTLEELRIDSIGKYPLRYCFAALDCESVKEPFTVYLEYFQVTPDAFKTVSDIRIFPKGYWRLNGWIPESARLSGVLKVLKREEEMLASLKESAKPVLVLYRSGASDEWRQISSVSPDTIKDGQIPVGLLKPGEYCLGF